MHWDKTDNLTHIN